MFNLESLKQVASENDTAKAIFGDLGQRVRFRPRTNLNKLRHDLFSKGQKVVEEEYVATFKKLQDLGVGSLVKGRGSNPDRFIWAYNLKDVAKAVTSGIAPEEVREVHKKRSYTKRKKHLTGKKRRYTKRAHARKPALEASPSKGMTIVINLPESTSQEAINAFLTSAKELKNGVGSA